MSRREWGSFQNILESISCGVPGWKLEGGSAFLGFTNGLTSSQFWLRVTAQGSDNDTGKPCTWTGRKWIVSRHATVSEIVQTALKAVLTASEHEIREGFKWRGVRCYDPHLDVNALAGLKDAGKTDARQGSG